MVLVGPAAPGFDALGQIARNDSTAGMRRKTMLYGFLLGKGIWDHCNIDTAVDAVRGFGVREPYRSEEPSQNPSVVFETDMLTKQDRE